LRRIKRIKIKIKSMIKIKKIQACDRSGLGHYRIRVKWVLLSHLKPDSAEREIDSKLLSVLPQILAQTALDALDVFVPVFPQECHGL
jgi:hypothetical protein